MKILIVEDSLIIAKGLKHYLESENYSIDVSNTYQEALNTLDKNYDLVILDVTLPDGNGFDLCKYIKSEYNYPVIFLTAKDTEDDIVTKDLEKDDIKRIILEEIDKLKPRDKQIIYLRYGLNNYEELTQKEVADKLGISQSYISRIEKKIIKNISNLINV